MISSVQKLALRGTGWNYLGSGTALLAQLGYTAFTARLLGPADFGAYATAQALVALLGYFTLTTLGNALIRDEDGGRDAVATAIALSACAGLVGAAAIFAFAPVWASLWHAPQSVRLIHVSAFGVLAGALAAVPVALLRSALRYRRAAATESMAQIAGMVVGVAALLDHRSAMALVIGQVAAPVALLVGAGVAVRAELAFGFSRSAARRLLAFSTQTSGQYFVYYLIYTAPTWLVSRAFGAVGLGLFSRANVMVTLPVTHLSQGLTKAMYPLYARTRNDARETRELIEFSLLGAAKFLWPGFAAVAGAAPLVVEVLLGPKWGQVADVLPPLALFGAVNLAFVLVGNPIEVLGHFRTAWLVQGLWLAALAATLAVCFGRVGMAGLLWSVAAVQLGAHAVQLALAARLGLLRITSVLRGYAVRIALSAAVFGAVLLVERETRTTLVLPGRAAAELALVAAIGCALYLGNRPRRETAAVHREQPATGPALGDVA